MAIYEVATNQIRKLNETTFGAAGVRERDDLQRLLRHQVEIIVPDVLVVAEEFCEWDQSRRRIDLLGIDTNANLVVIELKRTEDGGHMELQAIRYAAMVSTLTFSRVVDVFDEYLRHNGKADDARSVLLDHLGWEEPLEDSFGQEVRIVLVAAEFSKELTTAVMWLNDYDLDITCIRMKPYSDGDRLLIDVQQVIPLPEAAQYQVQIREKAERERSARREKSALKLLCEPFWVGLLDKANKRTNLYADITARANWSIGASVGNNMALNFCWGRTNPRVELYMHGSSRDNAKEQFDRLHAKKAEIEKAFGGPLGWERLEERRASRVKFDLEPTALSDESKWGLLQDRWIETMLRFERALRPHFESLSN